MVNQEALRQVREATDDNEPVTDEELLASPEHAVSYARLRNYMDANFRDLPCERIELDEQWQYVGCHAGRMIEPDQALEIAFAELGGGR